MTRYENKMRVKLGKPTIKGFIGHYFLKPYVRRKVRKAREKREAFENKMNIKFKEAFDFTKGYLKKMRTIKILKYLCRCSDKCR